MRASLFAFIGCVVFCAAFLFHPAVQQASAQSASGLVVKTRDGTNLSDSLEEVVVFPSEEVVFVAQGSATGDYFWNVVGQSTYSAETAGATLTYTAGAEDRATDYVTVNDGLGNEVTVTVFVAKVMVEDDNSEARGGKGPGCFISLLR